MNEQRRRYRKRAFRAGFVSRDGAAPTFCVIRDLSSDGARLELAPGTDAPDSFDLHINGKQHVLHAEIVWRAASEIGVRFGPAAEDLKPPAPQPEGQQGPVPATS